MIPNFEPPKRFRLRDGRRGTEYEAVLECITYWQTQKQIAEDRLEEFQRRLPIAEGAPPQ